MKTTQDIPVMCGRACPLNDMFMYSKIVNFLCKILLLVKARFDQHYYNHVGPTAKEVPQTNNYKHVINKTFIM